ncbi:Rho termination factor N-terminal domain-containing protein [Geopsychrobacter electrodiphilus]|uniref:Rho termination factor N-terminal domain-containing protein n=1 Tax=Geopsychrobacter electrodiphilus TaxID=225196 RepID=UPI00037B25F8|nr:Rho termination factor N-terminal domain-containing protein [Geopsychrobacter electrodiphilus]
MKLNEIKQLAKDRGLVPGRLRKVELIHSLQKQEGNPQCYQSGFAADCGQSHCLWRSDCI